LDPNEHITRDGKCSERSLKETVTREKEVFPFLAKKWLESQRVAESVTNTDYDGAMGGLEG
jgi:hypothetical protein